ncbi:MAG TPA: Gfo/Idh/MocA family oxidoreductase [Gemmataceae bacterium]|jgi:predicted dehydrogenase|nr:Gfo/Idh/MocA family oxidoreductase [Gemmataceae bacterium]
MSNLSRRGFLTRSLTGMAAAGLPAWYANELLAQAQQTPAPHGSGPNGALTMATIGTGTNRTRRGNGAIHGERGIADMQEAMRQPNVRMVAVCDVDRPNAEFAANLVNTHNNNHDCVVRGDYKDILRDRSIDAVVIGTPDHWHAIIAIAAMRAGKDVYCEKPLTLTLAEGKTLVRVARETNRILQTGSQQRSDPRFRLACELVRNNRIGRIHRVTTLIGDNPRGGPFRTTPVPEGLNWDFWLGPTPRVDYVPERCFYEFRWWYDYSGGKMTDWGAHHNDIAQWGLGKDGTGPTSIRGTGIAPPAEANCYNCHRDFEVNYRYGADGPELRCRANPPQGWAIRLPNGQPADNGILFEGENNQWIFVNRGNLFASAPALVTEALPQTATRLEVSTNHMGNFMNAVRTRHAAICNPVVGHRSCSVCHLGVISTRLGQALTWDPEQERFTGEHAEEANRMTSRPYRDGYRLDA